MTAKHKRIINETLLPLNAVIKLNGNPVDLSGYTVKFELEEDDGTAVLAATTTGVTAHPTQAFTVDTSADTLKCNGHGVREHDQVIVASTTTLPSGLAASTRYHAVNVTPNSFQVASTPGGAAIDITSSGTGTHTFYVVGSVQYDFAAATVDEAGVFRGWFTIVSGSEQHSFPDDEYGIPIEVVARGN